jgi:hypothetical protein
MAEQQPPGMPGSQANPEMLATLQTMFPHIPEPALRRALEVSGTPDLAATLLLENPWQAFMPEQQQAPPPQDDEEEDEEEPDAPPPAPAEPARKRRKVTPQDKPPNAGDTTYDCLFDDVRTKKSSLQLMNLGPKKLAHTRVALLHSGAKDTFEGAGGYWLVPLSLQDLDETWWKVLTPHLERKALGRSVEFRSLPEGPNMPDVAFDDLEAAQTRRANRPRPPRRAGAPAEAAAIVAALVAPCSDDTSDKVGRYLAQLFPAKCPLHYCEMKGGSKVESKVLTKDWHESHSTKRVSRVQEEAKKTSLLAPIAAKKYRYDIESRAMGGEWKVVEEASA